MTRLRAAIADAWAALRPEPDTTEGAVYAGLVAISAGFAVAGLPALSLIVPGGLLVAIGVLPALPRRR